ESPAAGRTNTACAVPSGRAYRSNPSQLLSTPSNPGVSSVGKTVCSQLNATATPVPVATHTLPPFLHSPCRPVSHASPTFSVPFAPRTSPFTSSSTTPLHVSSSPLHVSKAAGKTTCSQNIPHCPP